MIVAIVCDERYLKYAKVLIYSILCNTKGIRVFLTVYADRRLTFRYHTRVQVTVLPIPKDRTPEELRCFFAGSRARVISEIQSSQHAEVLYLDADSLVRNSNFSELSRSQRVKSLKIASDRPVDKFLISSIYFPDTSAAQQFCTHWMQRLEVCLFGPWCSDQLTFFETSLALSNCVDDISQNYCDTHYDLDSTIWCGKGDTKRNHSFRHRYPREYWIYRMLMNADAVLERFRGNSELHLTPPPLNRLHEVMDSCFRLLRRAKKFALWIFE